MHWPFFIRFCFMSLLDMMATLATSSSSPPSSTAFALALSRSPLRSSWSSLHRRRSGDSPSVPFVVLPLTLILGAICLLVDSSSIHLAFLPLALILDALPYVSLASATVVLVCLLLLVDTIELVFQFRNAIELRQVKEFALPGNIVRQGFFELFLLG